MLLARTNIAVKASPCALMGPTGGCGPPLADRGSAGERRVRQLNPSAARQASTACATVVPQAMPRSIAVAHRPRRAAARARRTRRRASQRAITCSSACSRREQADQRRVRGGDDRCPARRAVGARSWTKIGV